MRSRPPPRNRPSAKPSGARQRRARPLAQPTAPAAPPPPRRLTKPTVAILAGGRSTRMGRDKSALPWGRSTLLEHIRRVARQTAWPVRTVRRDLIPSCGPLSGIYTAFRRQRSWSILFLACDMPFVTPALLARIWRTCQATHQPLFTVQAGQVGFPFLLRRADLATVREQIRKRDWSLQALAAALHARSLSLPRHQSGQLANLNTREDWAKAGRKRFAHRANLRLVKPGSDG